MRRAHNSAILQYYSLYCTIKMHVNKGLLLISSILYILPLLFAKLCTNVYSCIKKRQTEHLPIVQLKIFTCFVAVRQPSPHAPDWETYYLNVALLIYLSCVYTHLYILNTRKFCQSIFLYHHYLYTLVLYYL